MNCADARLRMEPYATGNLSSPDREEFEAHVACCEGCRFELELARGGVESGPGDGATPGAGAPAIPGADGSATPGIDGPDFVRSGEEGLHPGGAFSASSELDDPGFASVASEVTGDASVLESTSADISLDELLASATPMAEPPPAPAPHDSPDPLANLVGEMGDAAPSASTGPTVEARGAPESGGGPAAASGSTDWGFEPADAGPSARPPEGSLFLAQEALARGQEADAKKRFAPHRLLLWGLGGVVGLALLGFAGWIVLSARPASISVPELTPAGDIAAGPETESAGQAAESPATAAPAPVESPTAETSPGQASASSVEPAPEVAPASPTTPPAGPLVSASTLSSRTPLPSTSAPKPETGSASPEKAAAPQARKGAQGAKRTAVTPALGRPADAAPVKAASTAAAPAPPASIPPASADAVGGAEPPPSTAQAPHSSPAAPAGDPAAASGAVAGGTAAPPATGPPAGTAQPHPSATSGAAPPAAPPAAEAPREPRPAATEPAPAPAPERPIDRIHMATVAAEERGDLPALQRLRATWKNFIQKAGVGHDRVRAKHELADCLWAIQTITGKRSDQREALLAYREYILNAPAGGADSRSITRARLLEDALSESR